ncbi:MAG: 4-hydroxy-3-methylbut-2-enyl diphosphate reductase [Bacilli bacterium]
MIHYPKVFGCCSGSIKAINMAIELKEKNKNKNVYIYKEILHNKYIIDYLEKKDIYCIDDLSLINKNDILIIRAHGEAKSTYDYLEDNGIKYYDATCINVKKIHELVINKYNEGYKIIIIGKKDHPEVIGTNGQINNSAIIIESEEDYKLLDKKEKYYVVNQTTANIEKSQKFYNYLKENNYDYIFDNTICNNQKLIHDSSVNLAKTMDLMIVIGGNNSSNTKELYNKCLKVQKNTYLFSNIKDFYEFIKKENISDNINIGITGSASTLKEEVYEYSHLLEFMIFYKKQLSLLSNKINEFNNTLINNKDNKIIKDAINKFININKDGKFLRGTLINLGYKLNGNIDNYSLPLAIAYETFQTSILIHDDIIDNANTRRGKETIHNTYSKEFKKYKYQDNTPNNLALCIGDIGFYYTNKLILDSYKNDKNFTKLLAYYNDIVINTIKGEILDVYLPYIEKNNNKNNLKEDDIFEIYKLKTSYYSIVGPFILGMILANSKQKDIEKMENILMNIGISFQIKDDILGIFSNKETLGKSVCSDIEEFKQTILYSYIKINKKDYYKELIKYYGKQNLNEEELKTIKDIIIDSGSLKYANDKINELSSNAIIQLNNIDINQEVKNILLGLITYLNIREK